MAKYKSKITKQEELILETSKDLLQVATIELKYATNHCRNLLAIGKDLLAISDKAKKQSNKASAEYEKAFLKRQTFVDEVNRLKTLKEYKDKRKDIL